MEEIFEKYRQANLWDTDTSICSQELAAFLMVSETCLTDTISLQAVSLASLTASPEEERVALTNATYGLKCATLFATLNPIMFW